MINLSRPYGPPDPRPTAPPAPQLWYIVKRRGRLFITGAPMEGDKVRALATSYPMAQDMLGKQPRRAPWYTLPIYLLGATISGLADAT